MFAIAYSLFFILRDCIPQVLALYVSLGLTISLILFTEKKISYRRKWKMQGKDFAQDVKFAFFNHVLLDRFLKFSLVFLIPGGIFNVLEGTSTIFQVGFMLVVAEFARYWLHRLMHTNHFFWQLHKVHHTPKKLHASNVVWVHPGDKIFQFLVDTMPFLLLGISDLALCIYFIFYTVHGFFQHSNLSIKLGFLNRIFSGPELHRWHHSIDPQIANHNFGNNLILWDQIFGTYYHPKNISVGELGVVKENRRTSIWSRLPSFFVNRVLGKITWAWYSRACMNPKKSQIKTLKKIIRKNRTTHFLGLHGIEKFESVDNFRNKIKPQEYQNFSNLIVQQDLERSRILTAKPAGFYASTSGTTGRMKLIPVTSSYKRQLRLQQVLAAQKISAVYPKALKGGLFVVTSPTIDGYTDGQTPFGSISGFLQQNTPKILQSKYIGSDCVYGIKDYSLRYQALALAAILNPNCSLWASANPSTFLKIIETMKEKEQVLEKALRVKTINNWQVSTKVKDYLNKLLKDNAHKKLIHTLRTANEKGKYDEFWPALELILTWTCGSCSITLNKLLKNFIKPPKVMDLGFIASEGRITLPFIPNFGGIPTLKDVFYEFVERQSWEAGKKTFKLLHEIEPGKQYYIFLTTSYGLYRYHINDVIEVAGYYKKTPLLKFVQKGIGVTNITGEKLSEGQVVKAIEEVNNLIKTRFFIALADTDNARYEICLEGDYDCESSELEKTLDSILCELNMEYQAKRESGRLNPLIIKKLNKGSGELYKEFLLNLGQRESQFKYLALLPKQELQFDFQQHVCSVA